MASGEDKKREARKQFVFERKSVPAVALSLKLSESTVRRWKREAKEKGDDWMVARSVHTIAGEGLNKIVAMVIEDFVILTQATIEELKQDGTIEPKDKAKALVLLSDSMSKAVAAAGRLAPDLSERGIALRVMQDLMNFVASEFPEHAPAIQDIYEPFKVFLMEAYE